jgi:hypothetical protein
LYYAYDPVWTKEEIVAGLSELMESTSAVVSLQNEPGEEIRSGSESSESEESEAEFVPAAQNERYILDALDTYTASLMDLRPMLEQSLGDTLVPKAKRAGSKPPTFHVTDSARPYVLQVHDKFRQANSALVERLGESNWQRHIRLKELAAAAENLVEGTIPQVVVTEAPKSAFQPLSRFHDSGLGSSAHTMSLYPASNASHASFLSSATDAVKGRQRVPSTPIEVSEGKPFTCSICSKTLSGIRNRVDWKMHVFADLHPYICTFTDCPDSLTTYPTRQLWAEHELKNHRSHERYHCHDCSKVFFGEITFIEHLSVDHPNADLNHTQLLATLSAARNFVSDPLDQQKCPLCHLKQWTVRRDFVTHLGRHLEEIALSSLPRADDGESTSDEESGANAAGLSNLSSGKTKDSGMVPLEQASTLFQPYRDIQGVETDECSSFATGSIWTTIDPSLETTDGQLFGHDFTWDIHSQDLQRSGDGPTWDIHQRLQEFHRSGDGSNQFADSQTSELVAPRSKEDSMVSSAANLYPASGPKMAPPVLSSMPDVVQTKSRFSDDENKIINRMAASMAKRTSPEDISKILESLTDDQKRQMAEKGLDPLAYYFRAQAAKAFAQKRSSAQIQTAPPVVQTKSSFSDDDNRIINQMAATIAERTSPEDISKILESITDDQKRQMAEKGLDPLAFYFRTQAAKAFTQKRSSAQIRTAPVDGSPAEIHPTAEEWETMREPFRNAYINRGMSLKQTTQYMDDAYGFRASEGQWARKRKYWDILKKHKSETGSELIEQGLGQENDTKDIRNTSGIPVDDLDRDDSAARRNQHRHVKRENPRTRFHQRTLQAQESVLQRNNAAEVPLIDDTSTTKPYAAALATGMMDSQSWSHAPEENAAAMREASQEATRSQEEAQRISDAIRRTDPGFESELEDQGEPEGEPKTSSSAIDNDHATSQTPPSYDSWKPTWDFEEV